MSAKQATVFLTLLIASATMLIAACSDIPGSALDFETTPTPTATPTATVTVSPATTSESTTSTPTLSAPPVAAATPPAVAGAPETAPPTATPEASGPTPEGPTPTSTAVAPQPTSTAVPTPTPTRVANPLLVSGPYLQSCDLDSVTVVWNTNAPAGSMVEYGTTASFDSTVSDAAQTTLHAVRLDDLAPGSQHFYRVSSNGMALAEGRFTASPPPFGREFTFAVIGDSGTGNELQLAVASRLTDSAPDLVLHVGDVIYPNGAIEDYEANFFAPYRDLLSQTCFYPVTGNHDLITLDGAAYYDTFVLPANNPAGTEQYYSFDYGNVHFVAIDTNIEDKRNVTFDGLEAQAMIEWVAADLAATEQKWKVAILHNPPYSSGLKHGSYLTVRDAFTPIFEQYGVDLVFSGDDHHYERTKPLREYFDEGNGVVYLIAGGAGSRPRPVVVSEFTARSGSINHFVEVTATDDSLAVNAIDSSGGVFDSYVIDAATREQAYVPIAGTAAARDIVVCAADAAERDDCDFFADGTDDHIDMKRAVAACPREGCTITLSAGTFHNTGLGPDDRVILESNVHLRFEDGARVDFHGAAVPADRYVFDIDARDGVIDNVQIEGSGIITVNNPMDHVVRVKGDVKNVFIGGGLLMEHLDPQGSLDEAIQVTGSVEVTDLVIQDVLVKNFGGGLGAAHAVEFTGFVHNSLVDNFRTENTQHTIHLRGISDSANSVLMETSGAFTALLEASDRNSTTVSTAALSAGSALYIGSNGRFTGLKMDIATGNVIAGSIRLEVSDGEGGWIPVGTVVDDTSSGSIPLALSGDIEFSPLEGDLWQRDSVNGQEHFWLRLTADANLLTFQLAEVRAHRSPIHNTFSDIESIDSGGSAIFILSGSYNRFENVTILDAKSEGVRSAQGVNGVLSRSNVFSNVIIDGAVGGGYAFQHSPGARVVGGRITGTASGIQQLNTLNPDSYYGDGLTIENVAGLGISVRSDNATITAATIRNNGLDTTLDNERRSGIRLVRGDNPQITRSVILDNQITPTQTYGILIESPVRNAFVYDTQVAGHLVRDIENMGRDTNILDR